MSRWRAPSSALLACLLVALWLLLTNWPAAADPQAAFPSPQSQWFIERIRDPVLAERRVGGASPAAEPTGDWLVWRREVVDGDVDSNRNQTPLALDVAGHPHICYEDDPSNRIRYARHDGQSWSIQNVGTGTSCTLALDSLGLPHIVFEATDQRLIHAVFDGSEWHYDTAIQRGEFPVLVLGPDDLPCLTYHGCDDLLDHMWFAVKEESGWQAEIVDSNAGWQSMAFDSMGRPHIAYSEWHSNGSVRHAQRDDAGWHVNALTSGVQPSLALDPSDLPHITFSRSDGLRYAWYDGTSLLIEQVLSGDNTGYVSRLALDQHMRPHVAVATAASVKYASKADDEWQVFKIDDNPWMQSYHVPLVLDSSGRPHVAYSNRQTLVYALWLSNPADWSTIVFSSYRDSNWELYAKDGGGGSPVRLTDSFATDTTPDLNVGASRVVYTSDGPGNSDIFAINVDGSVFSRLTFSDANEYLPSWSPSGQRIAYYSYADGDAEVYVMNADGTNQAQLTHNQAWDGHPSWSPDGNQIVFVSDRSGSHELWTMSSDGSNQIQVTTGINVAAYPDWSPDGSRFAFNDDSNQDGWLDLAIINVDGMGLEHPAGPSVAKTDKLAPAWAPHGRGLVYTWVAWIYEYGYWWWTDAHAMGLNVETGDVWTIANSGTDWWPDYQTQDVTPPTSEVNPLPGWSAAAVPVSWSVDDGDGAGGESFDIQVREGEAGQWTDWIVSSYSHAASFSGLDGHTYYFRSRARDLAYNLESYEDGDGDAVTTVDALPPESAASCPPQADTTSFAVSWSGSDAASGLRSFDIQVRDGSEGEWVDWIVGSEGEGADFRGELDRTYYFRSRARDQVGNYEEYPGGDGDCLTDTPRFAAVGRVLGNRDQPIVLATVVADPPLNTAQSRGGGVFSLYFNDPGPRDVEAERSGFGSLPSLLGVPFADPMPELVLHLPPVDDAVADGDFETGDLADWTVSGELTPVITTTAHSGFGSAFLGSAAEGQRLARGRLARPTDTSWQSLLEQNVNLPPTLESGTVSLLYRVEAALPVSDSLQVVLATPTNTITHTLTLTEPGWRHAWWSIPDWATSMLTLRIIWSQSDSDRPAGVLVDEVRAGSAVPGGGVIHLPCVVRHR